MLKSLACVSAALLGACAPVSSTGIYRTSVELTIASEKSPREFAMCVADAFPDAGRLLNEGEHYWLTRQHGGATFERWDFTPTLTGSIAERRSGQIVGRAGSGRVRECAAR